MRNLWICISLSLLASCASQREVTLSPNAPPDELHYVCGADAQKQLDQSLEPLIQTARETFPAARQRFQGGLPEGEALFVRANIVDMGIYESSFIYVERIERGMVFGRISNEIVTLASWKRGDLYSVRETEIQDWTITKIDGNEEGNLVGKFIEAHSARCR